ncbi:MAG: TadE family protein [Anaerovoracaceae bacterium]
MHLKKEEGQAMVEFALVLPVLILILAGIIDFGWIFFNTLNANNACREATRYTAINYNEQGWNESTAASNAKTVLLNRDPALSDAAVAATKVGEKITISFDCKINALTPLLTMVFKDGVFTKTISCTMRLE